MMRTGGRVGTATGSVAAVIGMCFKEGRKKAAHTSVPAVGYDAVHCDDTGRGAGALSHWVPIVPHERVNVRS
jgi:hypothetical protein